MRGLEWATLLVGLLLAGLGLGVSLHEAGLVALLPADPDAYRAAREASEEGISRLPLPIGFVLLVLCLLDAGRARSLASARALLRGGTVFTIVALAYVAGIEAPPDAQADGLRLLEAHEDGLAWRWTLRTLLVCLVLLLVAGHRSQAPPPPTVSPDGRYASPWIPAFFGHTPALPERQWRVLGLMIAAGLFNAYDHQIFSLALKQIQEGLGIDEGRLGYLGSVVRLGVIPGVLLVLLGDVWGRRRLLLITIVGYTITTGLTAFAPNETAFVACQFLSRTFGAAEATLAAVVVTEEIDAAQRGWALGVLGGLSFLGVALAWVLFAQVETLPLGWRGMYLVGLGPLVLLAWLRRRLPETERFESQRSSRPERAGIRQTLQPLVSLVRMYPARFAAVAAVAFLMSFSGQAAGFFMPKFLQDSHGLAPARLTLLAAGIGIAGMCAMPILGRLGDRVGRKPVVMVFIALNPIAVIGAYLAGPLAIVVFFFLLVFLTDIGSDHNLGVYTRELFPTSYRATAGSAAGILGQLGGSLALAVESVLYGRLGSHAQAIAILAAVGFLVPLVVARAYPETRGRVLEEISPER